MTYKEAIESVLAENGVDVCNDKIEEIESMKYMTVIVELEQKFSITLPDSMLDKTKIGDFHEFISRIEAEIEHRNVSQSEKA